MARSKLADIDPNHPPAGADMAHWNANPDLEYDTAANAFMLPLPAPVPLSAQLAVLEAQKEAAGVWFQPGGQKAPLLFATGEDAQKRMTRLAELLTLDATAWPVDGTWSTAAGVPVPFAAADVILLGKAIGRYVVGCTLNAVQLGAQIAAGKKPDLTQGWPSQGTPPPPPPAA